MQVECPECKTLNPLASKFCNECGSSLETAKVIKEASQAEGSRQSASQETAYYSSGDVLVTNTQAVFGVKTYALAHITSVTMFVSTAGRRSSWLLIFLAIVVVSIAGLLLFSVRDACGTTLLAVGALFLGIGVYWAIRAKPKYTIRIASASGETRALASDDQDLIEEIVAAIQKAIAERG